MKKVKLTLAGLFLLAAQVVFAHQNEILRGDSAKNSAEKGRSNPIGGKATKPGPEPHLQTDKYKKERAAIDMKYSQERKSIIKTSQNRTATLKREVKRGK